MTISFLYDLFNEIYVIYSSKDKGKNEQKNPKRDLGIKRVMKFPRLGRHLPILVKKCFGDKSI